MSSRSVPRLAPCVAALLLIAAAPATAQHRERGSVSLLSGALTASADQVDGTVPTVGVAATWPLKPWIDLEGEFATATKTHRREYTRLADLVRSRRFPARRRRGQRRHYQDNQRAEDRLAVIARRAPALVPSAVAGPATTLPGSHQPPGARPPPAGAPRAPAWRHARRSRTALATPAAVAPQPRWTHRGRRRRHRVDRPARCSPRRALRLRIDRRRDQQRAAERRCECDGGSDSPSHPPPERPCELPQVPIRRRFALRRCRTPAASDRADARCRTRRRAPAGGPRSSCRSLPPPRRDASDGTAASRPATSAGRSRNSRWRG